MAGSVGILDAIQDFLKICSRLTARYYQGITIKNFRANFVTYLYLQNIDMHYLFL